MDIPFLFPDDYQKLMRVEAGPAGATLKASTEKVGVKTLDIWHTGYKTFTANKPLDTPADFKGLKFRVMPSQIQAAQYEIQGAAAVNMDFSETYNALQNGALDGQENPLDTTYDMKFHEVQKYVTISRHGVLDQFIMASKRWFDGLDEPSRQALMKGVAEGREVALENTHKAEKIALDAFRKAGVTIKELAPEEHAAWAKAFAPVKEVYIKRYGKDAQDMLALFEREIAKD
jgi:C4-dicarboxylate-binding protein DctP